MKPCHHRKFQDRAAIFTQILKPTVSLGVIYVIKSLTKMASKYVIFKYIFIKIELLILNIF
jgi:hypothetical protein